MATLKSISKVPGSEKGVLINNTRFLKEISVKIENGIVSIIPEDGTEAFSGLLGEVEIDGNPITDPDEAIAALEEIILFGSGGGGGTPSPTPTEHNSLNGRDSANSHPAKAVTGLEEVMNAANWQ